MRRVSSSAFSCAGSVVWRMASGTPGMAVSARLLVKAQAKAQEAFDHRGSLFVNRARRGVDLEAMSKQRKNGQGPAFQEDAAE